MLHPRKKPKCIHKAYGIEVTNDTLEMLSSVIMEAELTDADLEEVAGGYVNPRGVGKLVDYILEKLGIKKPKSNNGKKRMVF